MATVTAAKPDGVYDANPFEMRMRPAQWIDLPAFPGQRYTYGRLARALRGHLSRPSPTHARVAAVLLPDGVIYKLDGHTRALAWHLGYLPAPETILVDVYRADSAEQARALYAAFDNPASTKNASDRVYAALRETGLVDYLKTPWLQHGRFATALRMIGDHASTVDTVERFSPALLQIDSLRPTRRRFPSGVLAAAIATAHVHGDRSIEQFWAPYSQDQVCRGPRDTCGTSVSRRDSVSRQAFGPRPPCVRRRYGLPRWEALRDDSHNGWTAFRMRSAYRLRGFATAPIRPRPTPTGDYAPSLRSPWRVALVSCPWRPTRTGIHP